MKLRPLRRASVIVVVLIAIVFAALVLTRLLEASSTNLLIATRLADRDRLRGEAHIALETTLAVLEDFRVIDGGLFAPAQGWGDALGYAGFVPREGVSLAVAFEDESAKLSLPRLKLDALAAVLEQLGLAGHDAGRVADAMFGWMHNGHVAAESATSATVYEQEDPPHAPPLRPLRSFNELAQIAVARDFFYDLAGRPTQLWHGLTQMVSLYDFPSTNLNSAGSGVMLASGWDDTQTGAVDRYLSAVVAANQPSPYFRSMNEVRREAGNVAGPNLGTEVRCLRINVTAQEGAAVLRLSALVAPGGQVSLPAPLAAAATTNATATANRPAASSSGSDTRSADVAGQSIRYPFTVLELTETNLPAPMAAPDPNPPSI